MGLIVASFVGSAVGCKVGRNEGAMVGNTVGLILGVNVVGIEVGRRDGFRVGFKVGIRVGRDEGNMVGFADVGSQDGSKLVGLGVGAMVDKKHADAPSRDTCPLEQLSHWLDPAVLAY